MNIFELPDIAENYDKFYEKDFGKNVDAIEKNIISLLLASDTEKNKMLEIGCGTGHWTKFFIEKNFSITAIDISDAMLNIAKGKNLSAQFIKADAENLPFPDNHFDIVATITVLEFVKDQKKVIQEVKRVLKPSGIFLVGTLNANSIIGKRKNDDPVYKNANFLTQKKLKTLLQSIGSPKILEGVYISEIIEDLEEKKDIEAAFLAAIVKKG